MTPDGLTELQADEGYRPAPVYVAFQDTGGVWTIAGGITGPGIGPNTRWSPVQAAAAWAQRVSSTESGLRNRFTKFELLQRDEPVRADVLVNIAFNIGITGLAHWPETMAAVGAGDWATASADILNNKVWEGQVHNRDQRCAHAMLTGSWSDAPPATTPPHPDIAWSQALTQKALES